MFVEVRDSRGWTDECLPNTRLERIDEASILKLGLGSPLLPANVSPYAVFAALAAAVGLSTLFLVLKKRR